MPKSICAKCILCIKRCGLLKFLSISGECIISILMNVFSNFTTALRAKSDKKKEKKKRNQVNCLLQSPKDYFRYENIPICMPIYSSV